MNKFLICAVLACCLGTASAQSAPVAATDGTSKDKSDVVAVKDDRPTNSMCPQSGTLIKRNVDVRSTRAVDCATSSPGTTYTRRELDSTGANNTAQALQDLDPAVRIHR